MQHDNVLGAHLPATYKQASELAKTKSMPPTEVLGPAILCERADDKPLFKASAGSDAAQGTKTQPQMKSTSANSATSTGALLLPRAR